MKKNYRMHGISALAVSALLLYAGCSRNLPTAANNIVSPPALQAKAITCTAPQADNCLSANLYNFYQSQSGNIFFSPFSIITALGMAQEGANGNTAVQMQNVLNLNHDAAARQQSFQQLIAEINAPGKHYTLDTADNLWIQQGFNILPTYRNVVETDYYAGVTNVDFVGNPSGALQTINGAVSQETEGYIPNLLSQNSIGKYTRLVLTNAIYFKGSWQTAFPVSFTKPQTFFLDPTTSESVSMMNETLSANVGSYNGAASVLAIPYQNNEASMYVFLPPQGGMAALEGAMSGDNLNAWLAANSAAMTGTSVRQVDLALPKFTFSTNYDLSQGLSIIGMPLAFTKPVPQAGTGADFSGIDGYKDLYITSVIHKAYVDVDETGTTAVAATGVVVGTTIQAVIMQPPHIPFVVDHPFIFMIVDNASNTVLFMGRVNDPNFNS